MLGLELAYVPEAEIETLIDQRVATLARQLEIERNQPHHPNPVASGGSGSGRGQITVQFFEKRRRKAWYNMRSDDEVCWESWTVKVTVAEPRTEAGGFFLLSFAFCLPGLLAYVRAASLIQL